MTTSSTDRLPSGLRILHIGPFSHECSGPAQRMARALTLAAPDAALRVDVACFGVRDATFVLSAHGTLHELAGRPEVLESIALDSFHALLRDCDLVHVHQARCAFGLYVAACAKLAGLRTIGTDYGSGESPLWLPYPRMAELFDAFHAQSAFAVHGFAGYAPPVTLIHGPVDDGFWTPAAAQGIDPRRIVSLAPLAPQHGHEQVIDALPAGCELHLLGTVEDEDYAAFLFARPSEGTVRFDGALSEADQRERLRGAGLCVQASVHTDHAGHFHAQPELLGDGPLAALSCGVPVLVSRAGALPELADLPGCTVFDTPEALGRHLRERMSAPAVASPRALLHGAVAARHGLRAVGAAYLQLVAKVMS